MEGRKPDGRPHGHERWRPKVEETLCRVHRQMVVEETESGFSQSAVAMVYLPAAVGPWMKTTYMTLAVCLSERPSIGEAGLWAERAEKSRSLDQGRVFDVEVAARLLHCPRDLAV